MLNTIIASIIAFISALIYLISYPFLSKNKARYEGSHEALKQPITKYGEITGRLPYTQHAGTKRITHIGQLKLFLTELEFLTEYSQPNEETIVVYAGSAPSNKLPFLTDMFPKIKWILVDPNIHYLRYGHNDDQYSEHRIDELLYLKISPEYKTDKADIGQRNNGEKLLNLYDNGEIRRVERNDDRQGDLSTVDANALSTLISQNYRYYVIEDFYTTSLSHLLRTLPQKLLFISDIRSNPDKESPSTIDILWNSAMMYNWLKVLQPYKFMIKFRCPFPLLEGELEQLEQEYIERSYTHKDFEECAIPFMANLRAGRFEFIGGEIWLQAFAPITSTESRLVGSTYDIVEYDINEYEEKFFYFNTKVRSTQEYASYTDKKIGIDNCHDCALMCLIFKRYCDKFGDGSSPEEIKKMINKLLKSISRTLFKGNDHPHF